MSLRNIIEQDLARAESVILDSEGDKRLHGPTVDNFKGQAMAYKKVLSWLEMDEKYVPIEINKRITVTIPWAVFAILAVGCILMLL